MRRKTTAKEETTPKRTRGEAAKDLKVNELLERFNKRALADPNLNPALPGSLSNLSIIPFIISIYLFIYLFIHLSIYLLIHLSISSLTFFFKK